jgi:threonine dehydrogenase-like Zn-dependent dehydrogenase
VREAAGPVALIIGAAGKSGSLSAAAARQAGAAKIIGVVPTEAEAALLRDIGGAGTHAGASVGPNDEPTAAARTDLSAVSGAITPETADKAGSGPSPTAPDARAAGVRTGLLSGRAAHVPAPEAGQPLVDEVVIVDARDPVALAAKVGAAGGPADVTVVCVDVPGCEGGAILSTTQGGTVIFFSMATSFSSAALSAEGLAADVTMLVGNGYVPGHADLALGLIRTTPGLRALFEQRLSGQRLSGQRLSGQRLSGQRLSGQRLSVRGVRREGGQP